MKKILFVVFSIAILTACQPDQPRQVNYSMPQELSDCKVHEIDSSNGPRLYVVRCSGSNKGSEVSSRWDTSSERPRSKQAILVIDGEEYQKVNK